MPFVRMEMREDIQSGLEKKIGKRSHENDGGELAWDRFKNDI